ncbi:MAG: right-handed parallel beta-helix repeat-containing protein [Candidatus Eisenbacteria sp.]|nr:right-handed parallel beta-helix repeat-containing protein [Candidatus Eisenbacteria bacterium]
MTPVRSICTGALAVALFLVLFASVASGWTVVVDPEGGGDFDNIPEASWYAGVDDTVLVMPGTYAIEPGYPLGWPINLHPNSPAFVSAGGADVTALEGDGTCCAFRVPSGEFQARTTVVGFTIRNTPKPIDKEYESGGLLHFTDNIIEDNGYGLDATWGGHGLIARNIIRNNDGDGINMYHFFGVIEENEVCYNVSGIRGHCCEDPTIQHNHVHHNTYGGIGGGFYCYAYYNLVEYNGTGLSSGSGCRFEHNIVRGNAVGVALSDYPLGEMHFNDIYDNTEFAVRLYGYGESDGRGFDATENWWGTTDPDEIADMIWDCHDDPTIPVCVVYDPWCSAPGCEPVPVEAASWGAIKAMYR